MKPALTMTLETRQVPVIMKICMYEKPLVSIARPLWPGNETLDIRSAPFQVGLGQIRESLQRAVSLSENSDREKATALTCVEKIITQYIRAVQRKNETLSKPIRVALIIEHRDSSSGDDQMVVRLESYRTGTNSRHVLIRVHEEMHLPFTPNGKIGKEALCEIIRVLQKGTDYVEESRAKSMMKN